MGGNNILTTMEHMGVGSKCSKWIPAKLQQGPRNTAKNHVEPGFWNNLSTWTIWVIQVPMKKGKDGKVAVISGDHSYGG